MTRYIAKKPYPLKHRLHMLRDFVEGTEIGDAVESCANAVDSLLSIGDDHNAQLVLLAGESVAEQYVKWLRDGHDWDEYNRFPEHVFRHFSDGEKKMSEAAWEDQFQ